MDILNSRALKTQAGERLANTSCDHKKLVLIHTGIILGANLLVNLLQMFLEQKISATGGLSGLGTRTILETIQTVLYYAIGIAQPFWTMGLVFVSLRLARGEHAEVKDLPEGFHRWGPVLRLYLLEILILIGAGLACTYLAGFIYAITPLSYPMQEMLLPMMEAGNSYEQVYDSLLAVPVEELVSMMLPVVIIAGVLFVIAALMLYYRFFMAEFIIMDQPGVGALAALLVSSRMTRRNRMKLLRLDLSFWWFYVLVGVSAAVMNADMILGYAGISLPVSADAAWIISYVLGGLIQLGVYWRYYSHVKTTHATAFDVLHAQFLETLKAQSALRNNPWNGEQDPQ